MAANKILPETRAGDADKGLLSGIDFHAWQKIDSLANPSPTHGS